MPGEARRSGCVFMFRVVELIPDIVPVAVGILCHDHGEAGHAALVTPPPGNAGGGLEGAHVKAFVGFFFSEVNKTFQRQTPVFGAFGLADQIFGFAGGTTPQFQGQSFADTGFFATQGRIIGAFMVLLLLRPDSWVTVFNNIRVL